MAVKVGNSWVSEAAYAYAKSTAVEGDSGSSMLNLLSDKFPDLNFSMNTAPFQGKGTNNLAIAPNILKEMEEDTEKRLEYEALIYDCNNLQKSIANREGLISFGFIINSDGTLGAWSISKSGSSTQRNQYQLDKKNKGSWLTQIMETCGRQKQKKKTAALNTKAGTLFNKTSTGSIHKQNTPEVIFDKSTVVCTGNYTSKGTLSGRSSVKNEEYLKALQKQVPYVKLQAGSGNNAKINGKAVIDVSPMLLEKMQNDSEAAKKYTQTLKDIETAEKTADAYYNALGGSVERWSYWYVDENGKYYHYAYTRRDDKLSKKLREEAKKNAEELIERTRENTRKKKEQLVEKLEEMTDYSNKIHKQAANAEVSTLGDANEARKEAAKAEQKLHMTSVDIRL